MAVFVGLHWPNPYRGAQFGTCVVGVLELSCPQRAAFDLFHKTLSSISQVKDEQEHPDHYFIYIPGVFFRRTVPGPYSFPLLASKPIFFCTLLQTG